MRSVLVTGAGRGIGSAITTHLAGRGWQVYAGARSDGHLTRLAAMDGVTPIRLDVTSPDDVRALSVALPERLDAVVNNAGHVLYGPVETLSAEQLDRQLSVNVTGQIAVTQAALPAVRAASGRIVFISSVSGEVSIPWSGAYCASKFAVEALADALRVELKAWGVSVTSIQPGTIDTDIWRGAATDFDAAVTAMTPHHRALYEPQIGRVRRLLALIRRTALPPERIAEVVERALTAPRPRARYRCDLAGRIEIAAVALTPTPVSDAVMNRVIHARHVSRRARPSGTRSG